MTITNKHPKEIRWAMYCVAALFLLEIIVGILVVLHYNEVYLNYAATHPQSPAEGVKGYSDGTVYGSFVAHLLLAVIYLVLGIFVYQRKNWARIILSVILAINILTLPLVIYSISSIVPSVKIYVIAEQILSLIVRGALLFLLWFPQATRNFFVKNNFN